MTHHKHWGVRVDDHREPNGLVRRAVRGWLYANSAGWDSIPKPSDEPRASVDGPEPDRVLLLGDGPAFGFGVTSHQLALPGQLARQVAALTHRGVHLDLATSRGVENGMASRAYDTVRSRRFDVAVTLIGPVDSIRLTPVEQFTARAHDLIERMLEDGIARVLVVGIPSLSVMPIAASVPVRVAQSHALALGRELSGLADSCPSARYLPFAPPSEPEPDRYRSASTYRAWASLIAPDLAGMLNELCSLRRAFTPPPQSLRAADVSDAR